MDNKNHPAKKMLALGDSYTVGEAVPLSGSFPFLATKILNQSGLYLEDPQVIAKTGWTTDELLTAISAADVQQSYDLVTLLIGVNNQYRGGDLTTYEKEFRELLAFSLSKSSEKNKTVFVLSIPDWGVTPFAEGRDRLKIREEIDLFNASNKSISEAYKVHYIDITEGTREAESDYSWIASDGLHPSEKEYARWAERLARLFLER